MKTSRIQNITMTYKPHYQYIPPITWSILTPLYDFCCTVTGLGIGFKKKVLASTRLLDGMVVADVGCGTGMFLKAAKERYPRVEFLGVDPDRKALAIAQRRLRCAGLEVTLQESFAESLPFTDRSIDVCFSSLAFHHMPDEVKRKAIGEMHRVLKCGGIAVIADFGETKSTFWRKWLFFERVEYLEGNFKGLIPQYFKEAGFKAPVVIGSHFPAIAIIRAQK